MWVIVKDGKVVSVQKTNPGVVAPGHEAFEWFGPEPKMHVPTLMYPDGTMREGQEADDDPRPQDYTDHREELAGLQVLVENEIAALGATIPNIDNMTQIQLVQVIKRLAQENLAILKALRYIGRKTIL